MPFDVLDVLDGVCPGVGARYVTVDEEEGRLLSQVFGVAFGVEEFFTVAKLYGAILHGVN